MAEERNRGSHLRVAVTEVRELSKDFLGAVAIAVLLWLLGGCATSPEVVKVPVPVPCSVETPKQPEYRFAPPYEDVFSGVRDLLGDREQALTYEEALRAALGACR